MNTRTTSASRFINEMDYAKLFAEKHAECMAQADKTDGAERTTWLNRAAYYASTSAALASTQRAGELAGEEIVGLTTSLRLAALDTDAMCATIERLTADLENTRDQRAARYAELHAARDALSEAQAERDITRVALANACGEIDHLRAALGRIAATATVDTVACHLRDMAHTALDY